MLFIRQVLRKLFRDKGEGYYSTCHKQKEIFTSLINYVTSRLLSVTTLSTDNVKLLFHLFHLPTLMHNSSTN